MEKRLLTLAAGGVLMFSIAASSTAIVAVNSEYAQAALRQSAVSVELSDGRGNFFDCDFQPLTGTSQQWCAFLEPGRSSYHALFKAIPADLREEFYGSIQQGMPFLMPIEGEEAARAQYVFSRPLRYQAMPIAQHLIGYVDTSNQGVSGLEYAFDTLLTGGSTQTQVRCSMNARGMWIESDEPHLVEARGTGAGVMLTLDSTLQRACEAIGTQMIDKGCILVLDAQTNRVRASVSLPLYDPEDVAASIARQDTSLVNRAVGAYNVGSVFKPLLAAAALEQGMDPEESYECTGSIVVGGHIYRCAYGRGHGAVSLQSALEQSCNCYFVQLGIRLGAETVYRIARDAGFGQSVCIAKTLRTSSGNLPDAQQLSDRGQLASISFGQGALTASPVQIAAMMGLFANGGLYIEPTFVEGIVDEYERTVTESLYKPVQRRAVSEETALAVRKMLVGVVENGLGRKAAPRKGGAGGKTGTAQTGRYQEDGEEILDAWFAGFYPAEEPRYIVVVLLDSGTHESDEAAQIFSRVADVLSFFV